MLVEVVLAAVATRCRDRLFLYDRLESRRRITVELDIPRFDKRPARQGSLRIGIGLLVIEAWLFALLAFAALPQHQGFWLSYLPYALMIPPFRVVQEYFPGWKGFVGAFTGWMLAVMIGFLARPTILDWLFSTVFYPR
jgi:hypothetical protein